MPQYAALIYGPENSTFSPDVWGAMMTEYTEFGDTAGAAGVIAGGAALQDTNTATTITVGGGKGGDVTTTDGPFAETKEVLGGFYLLECKDLDEALHWAAQIPGAWYGKIEVRPVIDFSGGAG